MAQVRAALDPREFRGSFHWLDTSKPRPRTDDTQEINNYVCCRSDVTESGIEHHSFNQSKFFFLGDLRSQNVWDHLRSYGNMYFKHPEQSVSGFT